MQSPSPHRTTLQVILLLCRMLQSRLTFTLPRHDWSAHRIASKLLAVTGCRRYAVIGGGLAGVATAWHLLRLATPSAPVQLDLFDPAGEEVSSC
jgi:FAD-NAD(P)-binding